MSHRCIDSPLSERRRSATFSVPSLRHSFDDRFLVPSFASQVSSQLTLPTSPYSPSFPSTLTTSTKRPRSNSHGDAHHYHRQQQTFQSLTLSPDTIVPGTLFSHPNAAATEVSTSDTVVNKSLTDFEKSTTTQPWDSPRIHATSPLGDPPLPHPTFDRPVSPLVSTVEPAPEPSGQQKPSFWQKCKVSSNYLALYKFCDTTDWLLISIGLLAAIGAGVPLPLIGILFGQLIDGFNSVSCSATPSNTAQFQSLVDQKVIKVVIVAIVNFVLIWIYTTCWSNVGERLVRKIRQQYLSAVLRQDIAFFDQLELGQVSTRLGADLITIQNGTSEKLGIMISSFSYFVTSYIVAFIKLPTLSAQLVSLLPAFGIISLFGSRRVASAQKNISMHLSHASSLASEALNNIAIVHAFCSQKRLSNIYQSHLELARKQGTRKALSASLVLGCLFFVGYSANALAFFSGSNLIASSTSSHSVGDVYTVIFLLLDASFIIGQIAPYLETISAASGASQVLLETIDRVSPIDATDLQRGRTPEVGEFDSIRISFDRVSFSYPSRTESKAIDDLTVEMEAGQRVGIVGSSGSGKSTMAALIQRWYDPNQGTVRLNGIPITEFNVGWLRSQIGLVGQQPVLFNCTVMQSIAHGLLGSPKHVHLYSTVLKFSQQDDDDDDDDDRMTAQQLIELDQIKTLCIQASKSAGAHEFILQLPEGYDTRVGESGGKLSGGQKQRICIARAIVKQPMLLLLDEATAALDSHSEEQVNAALDLISQTTTTIAIAHRLSTVRNYDKIMVMGQGKLLEEGSHDELLAKKDHYYRLAQAQDTRWNPKVDDEDGDDDDDDNDGHDKKQDPTEVKLLPSDSNATLLEEAMRDGSNPKPTDDALSSSPSATDRYPPSVILRRLAWLVHREWPLITIGLLTSAVMGGSYSGEAVLFGHVIDALNPCHGASSVRSHGHFFALMFFVLALIQLFAYSINGLMWGMVSQRLLFRIRRLSFDTILSHRLSWFDGQPSHSTLLSSLSTDANNLGGLTGIVIGTIFCILVNLTAGIIVSHIVAWRIAIVILALVPIILTSGYMRLKVLSDFQRRHETAYLRSNSIAIEAVGSIRTVISLGREQDITLQFHHSLIKPYQQTVKHFAIGNVFLSIALSISYLIYAFAYWWGSKNVAEGRFSQTAFFIVLPALLFSAQASGQLLAFAPDFSKAHVSAANILRLIDSRESSSSGPVSEKNNTANEKDLEHQSKLPSSVDCQRFLANSGPVRIDLQNVYFTYPCRTKPALRGINLSIPAGSFVGFVGRSGSGKSTTLGLIENLYTPSSGKILIDGIQTNRIPDSVLRKKMALVSQDAAIFYATLRFNVALGLSPIQDDPEEEEEEDQDFLKGYIESKWLSSISDDQIKQSCIKAGLESTILQLAQQYDTLISSSNLSGGQKQRVAIARSLIRNPGLLLLDEPTSALDATSESEFQQTIQTLRSQSKATIITVAHRVKTILDCDLIFVFDDGKVIDSGSYHSLMRSSKMFRQMVEYQTLE